MKITYVNIYFCENKRLGGKSEVYKWRNKEWSKCTDRLLLPLLLLPLLLLLLLLLGKRNGSIAARNKPVLKLTDHPARCRSLVAPRTLLNSATHVAPIPYGTAIIPDNFYQLSGEFSPTENDYFDILSPFKSDHIHFAQRLTISDLILLCTITGKHRDICVVATHYECTVSLRHMTRSRNFRTLTKKSHVFTGFDYWTFQ